MTYPLVFIGKVIETSEYGKTAMEKEAVSHSLRLGKLGLESDEQAEKAFHGGVDRALCHYPKEHYAYWQTLYPKSADLFKPALFGENLSTEGMFEETVYIGDIYEWGSAVVQVTEPRSPCYKLNERTKIADFSKVMQESGKIGWLYRVLIEGEVSAKEPLKLIARTSDVSIFKATEILYHKPFSELDYQALLKTAGLATSMSAKLIKRLKTGKIEDFNMRLFKKTTINRGF